jgi:predicted transcriptional regulator
MTARRSFRANRKSAADRTRERALRERLQRERPSLDDLVRQGECEPDAVMTMGMYFDVQQAIQALKRDRERQGLSIRDVAERSGIDRAVVSRLENGKQDNPTVTTLMR